MPRLALALFMLVFAVPSTGHAQAPESDSTDSGALPPYLATDSRVLGQADYDWRIRPVDGEETTLGSYRGEILFINLWASWCTPCIRELGSIERLRSRLGDAPVRFLVVAAEHEPSVLRFLRRYDYDLPFFTEISRIPPAFGMRGIPTSWVVDGEGRIVLIRHGAAAWDTDEVVAFLERLAEGVDWRDAARGVSLHPAVPESIVPRDAKQPDLLRPHRVAEQLFTHRPIP